MPYMVIDSICCIIYTLGLGFLIDFLVNMYVYVPIFEVKTLKEYLLFFSFGKSSPMNMELSPLATTLEPQSSNWKGSTFITMRLLEANTFQGLSSWIWNLVPWIQLGLDLTEQSSDPTTLFSANQELEIIGPKDTTPKVRFQRN